MYESLSKVEQVSIPAIYLGMEIIALVCVVGVLPQVKKVMTASDLLSLSQLLRSEASFQTFALNCCFPETLAEVVLGAVSSAVATVTDDWDYKFHVLLVISEDALESVAQVVEVWLLGHSRLENSWLHRGSGH